MTKLQSLLDAHVIPRRLPRTHSHGKNIVHAIKDESRTRTSFAKLLLNEGYLEVCAMLATVTGIGHGIVSASQQIGCRSFHGESRIQSTRR